LALLKKEHEKRRRQKRLAFVYGIRVWGRTFGSSQKKRHRHLAAVEKQGTRTLPGLPRITSKAKTLSVMPIAGKGALIPQPVTDAIRFAEDG
jgi:hypothetical protein